MYLRYFFKFVRISMVVLCMTIVLVASIMFICLSLFPPMEIATDSTITESQYVFAVFKESLKYSLLMLSVFYIADRGVRKADKAKRITLTSTK